MPRSSRSKSHKQKVKEYSDSEEDVKVKEKNYGKEEISSVSASRVSKDVSSGEKRKFSSQGRDSKDLPGHGNGDTTEENVVPKRRKERADGDRYNGGGDERGDGLLVEKGEVLKSKELKEVKGFVEVKGKSSRRHESSGGGSDKRDEVVKEESKGGEGGSRGEGKRQSEKDKDYSGRKESREVKEKERSGVETERKLHDGKDVEVGRKQQGLSSGDEVEERQSKQDAPIQDELQNPETEKELEKRARRRGDSDNDKYQDDVRHSDDKRSSRGDHSKDVRYKDEKHKDERHKNERHGDKYQDDGEKERHREDKYRVGWDKDTRDWDVKFREDSEKDVRRRDDKYHEDTDRDSRHDGERDKYCEDGGRDTRYREDKYHEHGNKDDRHHMDDRYRDDDKDNGHKEEKYRDDVDRVGKHRDAKQKNDSERDRDRRARNVKYRDVHSSRDRTNESDMKRLRDENATGLNYRKSSARDISPIYDDWVPRYKDDKGRRRANDNEGHTDVRSRNTKEHLLDADKRSISSSKVDLVTDRGRTNSRNTDVDATVNHTRHRNSPSSGNHAARDHYRASKPNESKYRDYGFEEKVWHNVGSCREFTGTGLSEKMSSSRSMEKSIQKDDSQIGELSGDRRPRLDSRTSPVRMVNKSPSSTGMERRHLNRLDIRRTIDVEESGQRSGGSREFSNREGRGSREFHVEMHALDEPPQHDGDSNVSSPFNRNSNFSGNSRSHPPPPPSYRTGAESSSVFGNLDDDSWGWQNNRHRRMGDSNMGRPRPQGNTWKGVPNWPSPVSNGFIPFQHGPPPVAFHQVMPQFPAPPMFGVRPQMDMNHNLPFHMPDADRFPGHGRPLSWRNPADEHGWDGNNSVFGDDAHVYGRLDWDQNRTQMSNRGWDSSGDMWKGKNIGFNGEMTSTPQKEDLALLKADEVLSGQSVEESHIEQKQSNLPADNIDVQSNHDLDNIADAPKTSPEENGEIPIMSVKDDIFPYRVYLSKIDISTDLIQPELYDKFSCLMGTDKNTPADEGNPKILYFEEVLETKVVDKTSRNSLYTTISDSVFQKAMSLYNKQKEEIGGINRERVSPSISAKMEVVQTFDVEKAALNVDKPGKLSSYVDEQDAEGAVPDSTEDFDMSSGLQEMEAFPASKCQKLDEPDSIDTLVVPEAQVSMLNTTEMEVDPVPEEVVNNIVEDNTSPVKDVDILLSGNLEEVQQYDSPEGNHTANSERNKLIETKCDPMILADVPSEVLMPEWIESGGIEIFAEDAPERKSSPVSRLRPDYESPSRLWARRKLRSAASMLNFFSIQGLPWASGQEKVVLTAPELESLRSELTDLEERSSHLKAQLEHLDEVLRSAHLSGYLLMRMRWAALSGEPAPLDDDTEVDDWLPSFVVLHGSCIFL